MTSKAKRYLCLIHPVILLAAASIMFPAGELAACPGSENAASRRALSAMSPAVLRTHPARQSGERGVPERSVSNSLAGKRDPFEAPPPPKAGGGDERNPHLPGVRGLVIDQLRLEGIVRDEESGSMMAVVTNQSNLAYFLHLHEEVYNGAGSRITPDAIYFQQKPLDPGGQPEAREIVLRLGSERQEAR